MEARIYTLLIRKSDLDLNAAKSSCHLKTVLSAQHFFTEKQSKQATELLS